MLWFKAWKETRKRFLIALCCVAVYCVVVVLFRGAVLRQMGFAAQFASPSFSRFVIRLVFDGTAKGLFTLFVIFLGAGGLLHEKARRTAGFTLSLPVTRRHTTAVRAAVGLLETCALALVPGLIIPLLSPLVRQAFALSEGLRFAVLWAFGGAVVFALSFLLSTLFSDAFAGPLIAYLIVILHTLIAAWRPLSAYHLNVMQTMGGWRIAVPGPNNEVLLGPLPWARLAALALVAAFLVALSIRQIERVDA